MSYINVAINALVQRSTKSIITRNLPILFCRISKRADHEVLEWRFWKGADGMSQGNLRVDLLE